MKIALVLALSLLAGCETKVAKRGAVWVELDRITSALNAYAAKHGKFPTGSAELTPGKDCCGASRNNKCPPDPKAWAVPPWTDLGYSIADETMFRFSYGSTDGSEFTVLAVSDLDCNGDTATWTLRGAMNGSAATIAPVEPPGRGHY